MRPRAGFFAALVSALLVALAHAPAARAHASLVKAEPPDGAMIPSPPSALKLTFNEPVSPLVIRLIGPSGAPIALRDVGAENATVVIPVPPGLAAGTHVLSWRVISADGHPVGGAIMFSIGASSTQLPAEMHTLADPAVRAGIWSMKVVIYLGLFVGVGGAFFWAWLAERSAGAAAPWTVGMLAAALIAVPISVGLQGLDALELPLSGLRQKTAWQAGLATAYGFTAITALFALFAGLFTLSATSPRVVRGLSLAGLLGVGLAVAFSGHATTAEPRRVSRAALFMHCVGIAFWIGSLLPLYASIRAHPRGGRELARFSRAVPLPLAVVLLSGGWLAVVQLERIDALWTTSYGQVLACKLVLVGLLLGLAAANRFWLVPRLADPGAAAGRRFAASLALELALALAILGLVALWRFTPPPRALADAAPISIHIHGEKAMAEIEIGRTGRGGARIAVLDGAFRPLAVKELALVLANPGAGVEPMRRSATSAGENNWRIGQLQIPVAGRWEVQVEMLISDFEKLTIEDTVTLPRVP